MNPIIQVVAAALLGLTVVAPTAATALCGDPSGDGHVSATDALMTLLLATGGSYDAAADLDLGSGPDAAVTATDALGLLVSAVGNSIPACAAATARTALVATASCDFVSGGIAEINLDDFSVVSHHRGRLAGDAVIRKQQGRLFVVNRFGANNIQELDPDNDLATLWQCSVGAGSNPHDIALVSPSKAYVSRYDAKSLAVIDPSVGSSCSGFVTATIDLSTWADADGFAEMDQMVVVGDRLFVSIQRLDRRNFFQPVSNGALVVIDTASDTVLTTVELQLSNPFAETKGLVYDQRSGKIYIGGPGVLFSALGDGGIEAVDPETLVSEGLLISGEELGGDLTDFFMLGDRRAYAIVAADDFVASLVELDLDQRTVVSLLTASPQQLSDIEITETGQLWLSDRDCIDPGLRVFSISDNRELTNRPIYPGLTPFNLLFWP